MNDRFRIPSVIPSQLREFQIPLQSVLRNAGLSPVFFQAEKPYASTAELFALWRAIGELSPVPGIGLKLGSERRLEHYSPSTIAAVCSRNFRDALQRVGRYKQLTCPEEIRLETEEEEATVEVFYLQSKEVEPDTLVDLVLSWILSIGRHGTDTVLAPLRLELTRALRDRELLETHYGCPVRFQADRNALVFRNRDLDRPFVTHNAELVTVIGTQLEADLQERNAGENVGEQVKLTLKRSLAGKRPTLRSIAHELGMSVRTLQRRLTGAGLTFQQLVENTRRELAHHYLKQNAVELTEAAFLLGFEDANSFFRAFHLWEGTSPGEWRTRHCPAQR